MATTVLKLFGAKETMFALQELPRRVYFRHQRIALSAAGGVIRDEAAARARRVTGLMAKSFGVKVKIPDSSFNKKHHGRPAYVIIGPRRRFVGVKVYRLSKAGRLSSRIKQFSLKSGRKIATTLRRPTRYTHLVEKGTKRSRAFPALGPAVAAARDRAMAAYQRKIKQGIEQEAFGLSKELFAGVPA